jgi:hypothetical protein
MNDELIDPSVPIRTYASQDQDLANRINQYRTALTLARTSPELLNLLQPRGYDDVAFAAGIVLCDAAQVTFTARQNAQAAQQGASALEQAARKAARDGFYDFRKIVRAVFRTDLAAQTALGAAGRVPSDQEKFLTLAAAAYTSALQHPDYLAALTQRGLDQIAIQAEQAKLETLFQANAIHEAAKAAAIHATSERNADAKALDDWWAQFRDIARVALKDRPDFLYQLGL